jgi:hypothetical protein
MQKNLCLVKVFLVWIGLVATALAAEEELTITTYYPSPYGSYNELTAYKLKIGTNYSGSGTSAVDNSLLVEGNVGIGTGVPSTKLYIQGPTAVNAQISFTTNSSYAGYNLSYNDTRYGSLQAIGPNFSDATRQRDIEIIADTQAQDISFWTNNTVRMNIKANGRVGIGTPSPTTALDVSGAVKATDYYAAGNIGTSGTFPTKSGSTDCTISVEKGLITQISCS